MPWLSRFQADGIEFIALNLLAACQTNLQDDAQGLLTWASRTEALPAIKVFNNARRVNTQAVTTLSVITASEATPESDGGGRLDETFVIELEIEIIGPEPNLLARQAWRYNRALRSVLWTLTDAQLTAGMQANKGRLSWDVTPTKYPQFFDDRSSIYVQRASMTATFKLIEG